jgi:hypothetical protein
LAIADRPAADPLQSNRLADLSMSSRPDHRPAPIGDTTRNRFWPSEDDVPIAMLFVMFAAFACIIPPQADTFYHLRSGQAMWQTKSVLDRELFSHTAFGQPLYNHWSLSQLTFYGLHEAGGPVLLTIAIGACGIAGLVLSWRLTRGPLEVRLPALFALMLVLPQWSLRPQVLSTLLLMLVLRLVLAGRVLWALPVIWLWANAHALAIFGVAIVGLAALESIVWSRQQLRTTLAAAVVAPLLPMISPLGVHYWPRVAETVRESRRLGIQEYRSAFAAGTDVLGFWVLLAIFVAVAAMALRRIHARSRADRILVLSSVVFAVAALISRRNGAFFVLLAVPAITRLLPFAAPARVKPAPWPAVAIVGVAGILAAAFVAYRWRDGGAHLGWRPMSPEAIAAVRACPAPLYNEFGDGGVLTWFVPEQPVFVDGRVEAYPAAFLHRVRRADLSGDYKPLFREYGIRCAVLRTGSATARQLRADPAMSVRFADPTWVVFVSVEARSNEDKPGV